MRRKQDVLHNTRVALSVLVPTDALWIHIKYSSKPILTNWSKDEDARWCREDTKSCFVFFHLHWQLDHHADDPLPAGSKVKAFILTDPAHTPRGFSVKFTLKQESWQAFSFLWNKIHLKMQINFYKELEREM